METYSTRIGFGDIDLGMGRSHFQMKFVDSQKFAESVPFAEVNLVVIDMLELYRGQHGLLDVSIDFLDLHALIEMFQLPGPHTLAVETAPFFEALLMIELRVQYAPRYFAASLALIEWLQSFEWPETSYKTFEL